MFSCASFCTKTFYNEVENEAWATCSLCRLCHFPICMTCEKVLGNICYHCLWVSEIKLFTREEQKDILWTRNTTFNRCRLFNVFRIAHATKFDWYTRELQQIKKNIDVLRFIKTNINIHLPLIQEVYKYVKKNRTSCEYAYLNFRGF